MVRKKVKKICCITGTRADYPRVRSVLKRLKYNPNFILYIVVTGSHLLKEYGYSYKEIVEDGFEIYKKVHMFKNDFNSPYGMALASAECTKGIAHALSEINPDLVLLTVDRVETLAAATAASLMNYPIAHIQGGEITGTIDEVLRHAITKLSHIHFPASKDAKKRILRLGENPKLIFQTGCPYIDELKNYQYLNKVKLSKKYKLDLDKKWVIFTQHAVTTEVNDSLSQIKKTISALNEFPDLEIICFFSNTDAGSKEIIQQNKKQSRFKMFPNMKSEDFASVMKSSKFMIGNSSAGLREAPTFSLPAINIGSRQKGRLRAKNVVDVEHDIIQIIDAINKCLYNLDFLNSLRNLKNPYGNGHSSKKIVEILEKIDIKDISIQKELNYDIKI